MRFFRLFAIFAAVRKILLWSGHNYRCWCWFKWIISIQEEKLAIDGCCACSALHSQHIWKLWGKCLSLVFFFYDSNNSIFLSTFNENASKYQSEINKNDVDALIVLKKRWVVKNCWSPFDRCTKTLFFFLSGVPESKKVSSMFGYQAISVWWQVKRILLKDGMKQRRHQIYDPIPWSYFFLWADETSNYLAY